MSDAENRSLADALLAIDSHTSGQADLPFSLMNLDDAVDTIAGAGAVLLRRHVAAKLGARGYRDGRIEPQVGAALERLGAPVADIEAELQRREK